MRKVLFSTFFFLLCFLCSFSAFAESFPDERNCPECSYALILDSAIAPTCTQYGITEGAYCTNCGSIISKREIIPPLGHLEVPDNGIAPTCLETGLTAGVHCSRCNEILISQEIVSPLGHKEMIDIAQKPTCLDSGLTQGKHCSRCGEILIVQNIIAPLGHDYTEANYQCPKICNRCLETFGEKIKQDFPEDLSINKITASASYTFPYETACYYNPALKIHCTAAVSPYIDEISFPLIDQNDDYSDYSWYGVTISISYSESEIYSDYSCWPALYYEDYYSFKTLASSEETLESTDSSTKIRFSVNWYGKDYTNCYRITKMGSWEKNGELNTLKMNIFFRLPLGYDGIIFSLIDRYEVIEETTYPKSLFDYNNTKIFRIVSSEE